MVNRNLLVLTAIFMSTLFFSINDVCAVIFQNVDTFALKNDSTYIQWNIDPRDPDNPTNYATRTGNDMGFTTSVIEYGTTIAYGSQAPKHGYSYFHKQELAGLAPGTTYHYRIRALNYTGAEILSSDYTFTTLTNAQMDNSVKAARLDGQLPKIYYVRMDGNNACNGLYNVSGSSGNCAFNTISKGMSVLDAGDTLRIQSGTYYGTASGLARRGIITHPIRIVADGNAIMDGQNLVATGFAIDINLYDTWTIEGFTLQNYNEAGIWANTWGGTGNNITIINNIIKNSGNGILVARDSSNGNSINVVIKNNYIENATWNGILISPSIGNRNVIVGNTFVNVGRYAVVTAGDYNIIEDNTYTTSDGYLRDGGCGHCLVQVGSGNAVTLRNNSFIGGHGDRLRVGTTQAWNVLIIENYFREVGAPLATYYHNSINFVMNQVFDSGSFQGTGMERLRLENNTIYDFRTKNLGWGGEDSCPPCSSHKPMDNVYITNNHITLGAATNPILINGFNNLDMAGNIIDGHGFQISQLYNIIPQTAHNLTIKNNVFYNKYDLQGAIYLGVEPVDNVEVKNNIFYNVRGYGIDNANAANTGINIAHNLLWLNGSQLSNAPHTNTLYADPLFVDAANGDFHLQAGSPALTGGEGGTQMGAYGNAPPQTYTYGNVSGIVTASGSPLSGATIMDGTKSTITNSLGNYLLSGITTGTRTITASKIGYQSSSQQVNIINASTTTVDFQLLSLIPPSITAYSPSSPNPSYDEGALSTFSVTVNQPMTSTWRLDNALQASTIASYTKIWSYSDSGNHNVSYSGTNANGSISKEWIVSVVNVPDTIPPIISGVSSFPLTTSTTISWTTDEPATSEVQYGKDMSYGLTTSGTNLVTGHFLQIIGLNASTTYHYRVISRDGDNNANTSADFTFTTSSINPPIGLWHLDETSGTIAFDSSANANHGTLNNFDANSGWTAGFISNGLLFDGLNDYLQIPYSPSLDLGAGDFTLEARVKIRRSNTYDRIISNYRSAAESSDLEIRNNELVFFARGGGVAATVNSGVNVVDGTWHHVAGTRNGTVFSVYVDGTLKNSVTAAVGDVVAANYAWFIGAATTSSEYINGTIDEVKIWNRSLSDAEILAEYNAGSFPQPSCSDSIQNQGETGVDCGGPCAACPMQMYLNVKALRDSYTFGELVGLAG